MNNENVFFSMTGYGRVQESNAQVQVCVEIKSLNQRFKEIKWRLPSLINSLEITGRKIIDQYFRRGSFDISIMIKFLNMGLSPKAP